MADILQETFWNWFSSKNFFCILMVGPDNSLWPCDTIWRHRFGSTLAQVMACCLKHLVITWTNIDLSICKVLCCSPYSNSTRNTHEGDHYNTFENQTFKIKATSPRGQWVKPELGQLTHWGRVTHNCVGKLTIIASDNGLSPERRQAIIWINAGLLLIGPLRTNFSEILIGNQIFSFKKMHLKMSSAKWRPFASASMC